MNSWSEVIIEWANCLGVVESSVESIQDFQDGVFFETLVSQLCRGNEESFNDLAIELDEDFVSKYLRAEYPRVENAENEENGRKDLYTATLLLVQCAQQPIFHRPMCVALKQETQVRIKRFLEVVLPCGKNLTRESIESAINALQVEASPGQTRLTPRGLPLREFFNSPAVKSARSQRFMNERNRELLSLRAQLETEQYEKADLLEDLKTQSEKVTNLQKKLEEKDKELRDLRIERLKPPTPQSCRKSKSSNSSEERFRRLADELEICNSQLVLELERTRGERDELARRLSSNEKSSEIVRDKFKQAEKTLENLAHELDAKNQEIAYLRVNTEELREHIRQTKRLSLGEQSFDAEPACDEALSSIVDLQLQEARKETCQLKKELAEVRLELENSLRESQKLPGLEIALRDKTRELDSLRKSLELMEKQLLSKDSQVGALERERSELSEKITNLRDNLQEKIQLLALNESDLEVARKKIQDLTDSLKTAQSETIELNSVLQGVRQELQKTQNFVASQEEKLSFLSKEKTALETSLIETKNELRGISISWENEKVSAKKLESIVKSCDEQSAALRKDLSLSHERLLLVNGERKTLETTLRSTVEKLETTEICLQKEKSRSTDLESVVERKNRENEDLRSVLDGLEATMRTERAEASALREKFAGSKKSCEDLESLLKSKETLLEASKKRENCLNEELESWRAKINELSDSLDNEIAKCREFETKLSHKNDEYAELEKKLIASQNLLEKTESEKSQIESKLVDAKSEISSLEQQQKRNISANDALQEYAKVAAEKIVHMESKIFNCEASIEQLNRSLTEKTEKVNELQNELNEKSTCLDSLERKLDESAKRETATTDELRTIESRLAELMELRQEMESQIAQERERSSDLRDEIERLQEKLSVSGDKNKHLHEKFEKLNDKFNQTRDKLLKEIAVGESLNETLQKLRAKNNELEAAVTAKENQVESLRSQLENSKKKLASRINEISIFQQNIDSAKRELEESRENYRKQSQETEEVRKELNASSAMNRELEEKLASKKQEIETVLSDLDECKKELASYVSKVSAQELDIEKISNELEESQENYRKKSQETEEVRKALNASSAKNQELEEKLASKKQEIETVLSDLDECKKELASYVSKVSAQELDIEKISNELAESQENYRKRSQETEEVRKELNASSATNQELEEKYKNRKIEIEALTTEKKNLEQELAKSANENSAIKMEIERTKHELENYALKIEKQTIENAMLNEKELESKNSMESLKLELAETTERLKSVEAEKILLEKELSSCALLKIETSEEIEALQKAVEKSRRDEEISRAKQGEERAKLEQRIDELSEKSKLHLQESNSLRNELENVKLERERLTEKMQETSNAVTVLEKRLVVAENLRMEVELEDKLKKEALNVVQAKLEQLGKEKIESELRMKEIIVNLQKVRTSQDQVMEAQIQALEEKSHQQQSLEQELAELRVSFEEKSTRLASEESRVAEVLRELEKFEEKMAEKSGLVEKLENSLESERRRVSETEQSLESLREKMREIGKVTQDLKLELNCLWDCVRETCPELARSKHAAEDDAERLLEAFVEDAKAARKVVSILSEANETLKERACSEKESAKTTWEEAKKDKIELEERLKRVENELETRQQEIFLLDKRNEELREFLRKIAAEKNKIQDELVHLINRWSLLNVEADDFVSSALLDCEDLQNLVSQRNAIENSLINFNERQISNSKSFVQALDRIFSSEGVEEKLLPGAIVSEEIQRDLASLAEKMNEFSESLKTYDTKFKSGLLKDAAESEKKLRAELERIGKEKKEIREKLDSARARSARMEKNMDELRNENKKVKSELTEELEKLRASIEKLEQEKADLSKRINEKADVETLHKEYGQKLEKIKQKMKTAYNEQIAKLNQEQEKILKGKMESLKIQTEQQCRKYAEDIAKYKAHISDLSSRYWDVGEKLLAESQEKQVALQEVQKLKELRQHHDANAEIREQVVHSRQKTASLDRREFTIDRLAREPAARTGYGAVEVIEEETTTFSTHRRHSVKSIQAMGNAFRAEDEEGEVFDSVYLADLKEGRCAPTGPDLDRLSELRMRNSMCRPHLKSSYAVETHLQPIALHEDDIKNGVAGDDVFNDSLSQSLLPGQKPKKKDRTQTSYKRPGPPTPSKNGGRLSLQGNELKSPNSRILKERNVERRTTATPRGLKNLFGTSMSRRQDENTVGTPKGRRLSNIFRKQRTERN